jgi:hypothetical protein
MTESNNIGSPISDAKNLFGKGGRESTWEYTFADGSRARITGVVEVSPAEKAGEE